jgi:hypothetical protein
MRRPKHHNEMVPSIGDRIEMRRAGILLRGTVCYADWLQVLVKWDDGSSSSLRVGRERFRIIEPMQEADDSAA